MKTKISSSLTATACRSALSRFWSENLSVSKRGKEFVITLPLLHPNGMQVVISATEVTPTTALLSDNGEVISQLDDSSIDVRSKTKHRELLDEKVKAFEMHRSGIAIQKAVNLPIDGLDVHLFGEALVSISHLVYRQEYEAPRVEHVYSSIRKLLTEHLVDFKEKDKARVSGKIEAQIQVDFLTRNLACKTVERRGPMREYMEMWGYRWRDLKDKHPKLGRSMFYDPENQKWNDETIRIGKSVCDIFEPYFDTDKIAKALEKFHPANN